jgi:hypothetical protein
MTRRRAIFTSPRATNLSSTTRWDMAAYGHVPSSGVKR